MIRNIKINLGGNPDNAKELVRIANTYKSDIDLNYGSQTYDCKSILAVMSLDLSKDLEISLISDDVVEQRVFDSEMDKFAIR